ncbi:unnamed protein product [Prunus brigantina]
MLLRQSHTTSCFHDNITQDHPLAMPSRGHNAPSSLMLSQARISSSTHHASIQEFHREEAMLSCQIIPIATKGYPKFITPCNVPNKYSEGHAAKVFCSSC